MGILLVYDVTDEASFNNIRNWMRNIEQHASDNVNKASAARCAARRHSSSRAVRLCRCARNCTLQRRADHVPPGASRASRRLRYVCVDLDLPLH